MYVGIGGPEGILLKPCVYEVYLCDMHDMRHMLRVIITLSNNYYKHLVQYVNKIIIISQLS